MSYISAFRSAKQLVAVKSADETIVSDSTVTPDADLVLSLQANKQYLLIVSIFLDSVAAADFKHSLTLPSGATGVRVNEPLNATAPTATIDVTTDSAILTDATEETFFYYAKIIMGSTAGDISFDWAQNTSNAGDTVLKKGSSMVAILLD